MKKTRRYLGLLVSLYSVQEQKSATEEAKAILQENVNCPLVFCF
jgi:hypothetical protein